MLYKQEVRLKGPDRQSTCLQEICFYGGLVVTLGVGWVWDVINFVSNCWIFVSYFSIGKMKSNSVI